MKPNQKKAPDYDPSPENERVLDRVLQIAAVLLASGHFTKAADGQPSVLGDRSMQPIALKHARAIIQQGKVMLMREADGASLRVSPEE
jgi:hypothetical protein